MRKITVNFNPGIQQTNTDYANSNQTFHRKSFRYFIAVIPISLVFLISTSYQQNPDNWNPGEMEFHSPEASDSLRALLLSSPDSNHIIISGTGTTMLQSARIFYSRNGYKPVWVHYQGINQRAATLVYLIGHAREYGLEPDNYNYSRILSIQKQQEQESMDKLQIGSIVNLEVLLTDAAFRLMVNLHAGYQPFDSAFYAGEWLNQLPNILLQAVSSGKIAEKILSVEPHFIEYKKLRHANMQFVKNNNLTDNWIDIKYPTKDSVVLYKQIKEALIKLGYIDNRATPEKLTGALMEFQHFHGLQADGKPGRNTVDALTQSTLYKYRVLALNLDRLRKKQDMDSNVLYVNIPSYYLKVFQSNSLKDSFRVIVGHPKSPTPILSGNMQRIIANPVWYVPRSITIREMLPRIKEDSGYLTRNRLKLLDSEYNTVNHETLNLEDISEDDFDYTIRQDRGVENSLGQVKFVFSNPYAIYLHDTPGKSLFSKDLRAFSHGCVRVEHPEKLANYILTEINADTTNIARLITLGKHRDFSIDAPLSIHITYVTCEADDSGRIYFFRDIYELDSKELEKLALFMPI